MKVVIVDDEPTARHGIRIALQSEPDIQLVAECRDGRSALKSIRELAPDLMFMDVRMPAMDGIEVVSQLRAPGAPAVIFTTAYEQYALDAFALQAVDYLVKPWRKERFQQAITRARLIVAAQRAGVSDPKVHPVQGRFAVVTTTGLAFLTYSEIELVEAAGNYISLSTPAKSYLVRGTIESFESKVSSHGYIRVHRSLIVNLQKIKLLRSLPHGEYSIELTSGRVVRSGRSYRVAIQQWQQRNTSSG